MFWTLFGSSGKVGPSHDKTGVFCKHEHRAGEIDVRGIVYTTETICFIKKKSPRAQRGEEENEAEDQQDDEEIWAYRLSVVQISQNESQK